jgi:hypothetical protein
VNTAIETSKDKGHTTYMKPVREVIEIGKILQSAKAGIVPEMLLEKSNLGDAGG